MRYRALRTLLGPAIAGAVLTMLLAGCAGLPFGSQSASQLASGAAQSWVKASGFRFTGTESVSEGTLHFTVTESTDGGQGKGTGTLAGKPFSYLAASSNQYLKGQSFWQEYYTGQQDQQTTAKGFESKWAQATGNDVALALQELPDLGGVVGNLESDANSFKKGAQTRTIDGHQATPLTFGGDTFWVAPGNPDQLVGFSAATAGELQNVNVTIASAKAPDVAAPSQAQTVNPDDPSTLPAQYQVLDATNNENSCDENSCEVSADVMNQGGAPQGTSTLEIIAQDPNTNATIATCTATIPAIPAEQSGTASCTISGPAWHSWALAAGNADGGFFFFNATAQITANPPYVGSATS